MASQLAQRMNGNAATSSPRSLKMMLSNDDIKRRFKEMLGNKAAGFMSSIINVTNNNTMLQECDPQQIIACAAVAASMDLPIDPNLGFSYIVPYREKGGKPKPQFQMGYKGYIQLALRSGQYKNMNAAEIYEGELLGYNRITGDVEFDPEGKTSDTVVGYVSFFRLINGFERYLFMTVDQMRAHAKRYSKSFERPTGPWRTNELEMSLKTVLKLNLSKYGILSIDMQRAVQADQALIHDNGDGEFDYEYIDNDSNTVEGTVVNDDEEQEQEQSEGAQDALGDIDPNAPPNYDVWDDDKQDA